MNKILNRYIRRVLRLAEIVLIIVLIINALHRNEARSLRESVPNIYIPVGMANTYKSNHLIFERKWVYKISKKEAEEISIDLKNEYWRKLSEADYEKIKEFYSPAVFETEKIGGKLDFQNTYYALYDYLRKTYIEPQKLSAFRDDNHISFMVFIYDGSNRYYYTLVYQA